DPQHPHRLVVLNDVVFDTKWEIDSGVVGGRGPKEAAPVWVGGDLLFESMRSGCDRILVGCDVPHRGEFVERYVRPVDDVVHRHSPRLTFSQNSASVIPLFGDFRASSICSSVKGDFTPGGSTP